MNERSTREMTDDEFMASDEAYLAACGDGTVEDADRVEQIAGDVE